LEARRTGGMTVIAILSILVGGIEILAGVFPLWSALDMIYYEGWTVIVAIPAGLIAFALLLFAAGTVGGIAGLGTFRLRSSARRLSLMFGGLLLLVPIGCLMLISAFTPFIMPIIASIGSYDPSVDRVAMIAFAVVYLGLPAFYAVVLFIAFNRPAWQATFARG
jgi:hypothetical protein